MNYSPYRYALPVTSGLVVGVLILVAGCTSAPPPVHSMQNPQADFTAYKTFAWDPGPADGQPVSILDSNIRGAITNELQRKGYAEAVAGAKPDLVLQYETAAAEKLKSNPFRIGIGMGGVGSSGAAGVGVSSPDAKNVREGTLVLRAIDPARNAEMWNGRVSRELGKGGPPDQALISSAVADLLEKFPAQGGGQR
ncbi:MAG TPA: DUF4136 domain-containing protein [Steroidobacteraceae bacterium]|nr:DUF4136 domain-containing protein [Steroidobacteraceae bacterium]